MKNFILTMLGCVGLLISSGCLEKKNESKTTTFGPPKEGKNYFSPTNIQVAHDQKTLFIVEFDQNQVRQIDANSLETLHTFPTPEFPTGLAVSKTGERLYLTASCPDGNLVVYDGKGKVLHVVDCGHSPTAPTLSPDGKQLAVCDLFGNQLYLYTLDDAGKPTLAASVPMVREPAYITYGSSVASETDSAVLYVSNQIPDGPANDEYTAATISVVEYQTRGDGLIVHTDSIPLLNGSINVRQSTLSPDEKYLIVPMVIARYQVPTTRIDRGWLGTNSLTMIDVKTKKVYTAFSIDDAQLGATNPWLTKFSSDGQTLIAVTSGSDELITLNYPSLIAKIEKRLKELNSPRRGKIKPPPPPEDDLGFIYELRQRSRLQVRAPRTLALIQDSLYVPGFFSDDIDCVNLKGSRVIPPLHKAYGVPFMEMPKARRGEAYFNDGRFCSQQWLSCITCHPDGRADGINWDLSNDGEGNPKNTKSMLYSIYTPPCMATGIRPDAEYAIRSGVKHIQFFQPLPEDEDELYGSIEEYYKVMKPVPSPYLMKNGELSPSAQRGKEIFAKAGCVACHNGPYLTNMKQYDVGTTAGMDKGRPLDTPTLYEMWRTAPYMHDGRTSSVRDVITTHNPQMRGNTKDLTDQEVSDLEMYLLSL